MELVSSLLKVLNWKRSFVSSLVVWDHVLKLTGSD
jgi:hypothetical protein